ncbi:MAG: DUF2586 family protein [Burkholderiaceae bacterium]|jgi:phage tail sheath protein FI|nr:DUF2586 family protein [Burkholderiaceae bacterium]
MPSALTYPGVYVEELPSGVRTVTGVATSIALFIGWATRGPVDKAVRITSFADFERAYGGLDARSPLGYAVRHFYDNGGADAYVVRLAKDAVSATGAKGDLNITATSPGQWGNGYKISTALRPSPDDDRFRLDVLDANNGDAVVESFSNLSMDPSDPQQRFVESVINGRSSLITVSVASASLVAPANTPAVSLSGGDDGALLKPNDADFNSALLASSLFGLGSITDRIDLFNLVCVPGETDPATLAILQKHCKDQRAFLIVDADPAQSVADYNAGAPSAITGDSAPNSAMFFPWVKAPDPLQAGALRDFPPCGFVAGVFARTDATRGVWKAPAGSAASINGATGLAVTMSDAENGQLNPLAINCLRTLPVYGNVVWGSRTLHGQTDRGSEWKDIPVRRTALFIEESLYRGTQWVVFEPNDEPLWAQIRLNIGAFMHGLFRQGAFQGSTPKQAYFVKCDSETTTQADINLGIVNILVGFAPLKPAEFVVLKLQQIAGDIPT